MRWWDGDQGDGGAEKSPRDISGGGMWEEKGSEGGRERRRERDLCGMGGNK